MVLRYKKNYFFILITVLFISADLSAEIKKVRVLLDEQLLQNIPAKKTEKIESSFIQENGWHLHSADGFVLADINSPDKKITITAPELEIKTHNGALLINGKRLSKKHCSITPINGRLAYKNNTYEGTFLIVIDKQKAFFINAVDLEDYVLSVLCTESWPGWPLEVNKVMAIACRSYAIYMILQAQEQGRMFHIKNTNAHQTYTGLKKNEHLKEAVSSTCGIFLAHNKKPIIAMFDSCCGGVIPAKARGSVDFKKAPYLARSYACDFCKRCKLYNWSVTYERAYLEETFKKVVPKIKRVKDITVAKKDPAGLVRELSVKSSNGYHALPGKKVYSLLKDGVKSFCYTVTKKTEKIVFDGRGYGHHMGLCQWGSREMVRDGWEYKDILEFYYPGTVFMRVV